MLSSLQRLSTFFLIAFVLLALATGYWSAARSQALIERADNPRRFFAQGRVRRGAILDAHGEPLAQTVGGPGEFVRHYPYPDGAPVIGYYSLRYGAAGAEAAFDGVLRGEAGVDPLTVWWNVNVLGQLQRGRDVRLTLDLDLQRVADGALGGLNGAAVLMDVHTGDLLALASQPTFDPNRLEDEWAGLLADPSAPLLNRATLGLYQPGGALQPILAAAAYERLPEMFSAAFPSGTEPLGVGDQVTACAGAHPDQDLDLPTAFALACPGPFAVIGQSLAPDGLLRAFDDFRLFQAPPLPLPTVAASRFTLPAEEVRSAAIGQAGLTVSPLQMALSTAAIANLGLAPAPRIVDAVQAAAGGWVASAAEGHPTVYAPPDAAQAVAAMMVGAGNRAPVSAAQMWNVRVAGHASAVVSGASGQSNAWFLGFAPAEAPQYAVAVILENGTSAKAAEVGGRILAATVTAQASTLAAPSPARGMSRRGRRPEQSPATQP